MNELDIKVNHYLKELNVTSLDEGIKKLREIEAQPKQEGDGAIKE